MSADDNPNPHVSRLRDAYHTWNESKGRDTSKWLALTSPHFKLRSLGDGAPGVEFTRARDGRAQLEEYFNEIHVDWEFLSLHADEFIAQGDRVVMLGRGHLRNRRTGKDAHTPLVHVWRFQNGEAVDFWELYDTAAGFAAMQADPLPV